MTSRTLVLSLISLAAVTVLLGGCAALLDARASEREAVAEARYPPKGEMVEVEGVRIHAHVEGSGPDLVMIHGASGNLRDFTFALSGALADEFRVIAFDRPGLGWSDLIEDHEDPRAQARVLRAAAEALGVRRPLVLGHSYGGAVALAWALQAQEDTAGLVVLGGASHEWEGRLGITQTLPATALGRWVVVPVVTAFATRDRVENAMENVFRPQPVPEGYAEHIGAGLTLRRDSLVWNAEQISSLKPFLREMQRDYGTLELPIEVVHGDADRTVGLEIHGRRLAEDAPGAALTVLEGVGHMPHHAAQEAVIAAVRRAADRAGLR